MAINANIISGLQSPVIQAADPMANYGKALQLKGLLTQNQIQDQTLADENGIREAYKSSGGDANAALRSLMQSGNYKGAQTLQKQIAEQAKSGADLANTQATTQKTQSEVTNQEIARHRDQLTDVNDPQSAAQWVTAGYNNPVTGKIMQSMMPLGDAIKRIPADPILLNQWKQQAALGATKYIEQNKPTYQTRNLGGTTDTIALPGLGGPAQTVSSMRNTQSPDSIASNATTQRGQNMVDARTQQTIASGKVPSGYRANGDGSLSPIPGGPADNAKALNDGQSKAALFGARMQASDQILNDLAKEGVKVSVPGSRAGYGVGSVVNAVSPARQQQLDQAKRDFINATLRRESGASISPAEFDNAEKQYFPQVGEGADVIAQKANNRAIATRGVLAEVPATQRDATVKDIIGTKPKSGMAMPIKTADDYAKLPSGATYIDPNGKTRQKP